MENGDAVAVTQREFGRAGIWVSILALGTMRFAEKGLDVPAVRALIAEAADRGVLTHHVSTEYASHAVYREALLSFPKAFRDRLTLVAKLPFPHFKDADPRPALFAERLEACLRDMRVDRIGVVQWLFRSEPLDDALRIPRLRAVAPELAAIFAETVRTGKAGAIAAFPYTPNFWREAARLGLADGQVNYLNLLETDYVPFLDDGGFLAIRPLAAGKLSGRGAEAPREVAEALREAGEAADSPEALAALALNFPLWHPRVASVIVSLNSRTDLDRALSLLRPETDPERFRRVARAVRDRTTV